MSDLHKPLKAPTKPGRASRSFIGWFLSLAAVLLLGGTAYLFFTQSNDGTQRVAITKSGSDAGRAETGSKATSGEAIRQSVETEPLSLNPDGTIDVSKVKKLSPLLPIDKQDGSISQSDAPTPVFVPQATPQIILSDWVPRPDMVQESQFGPLPKISDGGIRPLDAYSKSAGSIGANRVAIIIGGMGISQTGTQKAIADLPANITLGFSPVGNSLQRWMRAARRGGHEVVLQLPMEPLGYPAINPGPRTLTSQASDAENMKNLHWALARMTNYPLVMNYLGAGLGTKPRSLRPIFEEIRRRGLGYIDDGSAEASKALELAQEMTIPNAKGTIVLDGTRQEAQIKARLRNLENIAKTTGFAIGTANAFPETVAIVKDWVAAAQSRGIIIVPASNLIKDYKR